MRRDTWSFIEGFRYRGVSRCGTTVHADEAIAREPCRKSGAGACGHHFQPLADLCATGDVRIHIDRVFALHEVPAALMYVGEGRALGKVVVTPF